MDRTSNYYELLKQVDELSDEELIALSGYVKIIRPKARLAF
jgi:hypothetical protein